MSDTSTVRLPAIRDLQSWIDRDWTGGIVLDALQGLEQFVVRTLNTTYEITVLSPRTRLVLVRGGRFFPDYTRATLAGCSLGGSVLKMGVIHEGFMVELLHDGRRIVTTSVREIRAVAGDARH
jgi:hypothetical protein